MEKVYITGHRNPDLDSVCSALGYAYLKNKTDPGKEYIPVRCGHLSQNVSEILKASEISAPIYMRDCLPKVCDVMLTSDTKIDVNDSLMAIASTYKDSNPSAIPVYDNGAFAGLISVDDITGWAMKTLSEHSRITDIPKIGEVMRSQDEPLMATELFEDAKLKLSLSKRRGLAVVNENGFVGYVTRRCFLKAPKYNIILVDHNEPRQSIKGIESANVMEIIDHHRIDAVKTEFPVFIDAEPLGSTCTIVYQLYLRHHVSIPENIARTLLTGLLSDTVLLKSPTTTTIDIRSAQELAVSCGLSVQEFGEMMFSHVSGLSGRKPEEAISSDFKTYTEKNVRIGIGQCEVTTLRDLGSYCDTYLGELENYRISNGLDWAVLMITDILREHSILLTTEYKAAGHLPYSAIRPQVYDMPGILSRKKQLLPEIISTLDFYS